MRQYETFELKFDGPAPAGSEAQADLTAEFTMGGVTTAVKGFYAGNGTYMVRYYPAKTGTCTWKVRGVLEAEGQEDCAAAEYPGMVKAQGRHFVYENGDPYYPFGTTVYALAHQPEDLIETTFASLATAPFNKIRHCLFPKHYAYNHNEPEYYPFEKKEDGSWDVHRPCYAYWEHMEGIIRRLGAMGIESDLILFHPYDNWGFASLSMEENLVYLDYVLRRLSAIPCIWWSLANEYDLMASRTVEDWYAIEDFVAENDPYHHLIGCHNCMKFYDHTRPQITHASIQTPAMQMADAWQERYDKPVMFDEVEYEGDIEHGWGNISAFELVNRFWKGCVKGSYVTHGETFYSEDEILWWSKGGVLKGESPARIGFLKDLLYSLPGPVEPWEEPIYEDFANLADSSVNERFMGLLNSLSTEEKVNLSWKDARYGGHIGDEVYIQYIQAEKTPRVYYIHLPKEYTYRIELLDVWEMSRKTIDECAGGKTRMTLPGKGGIAVLATRIG